MPESSDGLADAVLAAIEARAQAASAGPWVSWVEGREFSGGSHVITTADGEIELGTRPATQDFIAAAREDIPRLLAEIHRLRGDTVAREDDGGFHLSDVFYLSDVEARCLEALPGPWQVVDVAGDERFPHLIRTGLPESNRWRDCRPWGATENDLRFIAHSRTDVPLLIAEIRRLRMC